MSIDFDRRCLTVFVTNPTAQALSQSSYVGGWGYPKSDKVLRISTASRAAMNRAAFSASAADATTLAIWSFMCNLTPPICPEIMQDQ